MQDQFQALYNKGKEYVGTAKANLQFYNGVNKELDFKGKSFDLSDQLIVKHSALAHQEFKDRKISRAGEAFIKEQRKYINELKACKASSAANFPQNLENILTELSTNEIPLFSALKLFAINMVSIVSGTADFKRIQEQKRLGHPEQPKSTQHNVPAPSKIATPAPTAAAVALVGATHNASSHLDKKSNAAAATSNSDTKISAAPNKTAPAVPARPSAAAVSASITKPAIPSKPAIYTTGVSTGATVYQPGSKPVVHIPNQQTHVKANAIQNANQKTAAAAH